MATPSFAHTTGISPLRLAIETLDAKTTGATVMNTFTFAGDISTANYVKGRVSIKVAHGQNSDSQSVCITVSPPAPFRCILVDPDSTRTTEMRYAPEQGKFIRAHVIPKNDYRDIPAHIVFHVEAWHAADIKRIVERIASRF